ncbi:DUF6907 domain-containing protein [Citricoccus nitrophenolicus]|uniref:DUF6907 domain-containing protein n=1 Tax=Citricoccus nitrophenolicus TaxID=863575 RepID=UPI0031F16B7C
MTTTNTQQGQARFGECPEWCDLGAFVHESHQTEATVLEHAGEDNGTPSITVRLRQKVNMEAGYPIQGHVDVELHNTEVDLDPHGLDFDASQLRAIAKTFTAAADDLEKRMRRVGWSPVPQWVREEVRRLDAKGSTVGDIGRWADELGVSPSIVGEAVANELGLRWT